MSDFTDRSDPPAPRRTRPTGPAPRAAAPPWARTLARQWRHHPLLRIAGICVFTWLFFIAYFELLREPVRPVTVMPLTALDHWIPFQPGAIWAYVSLWVYVGLAPGLLPTVGAALRYAAWAALLCGSGLLCFFLWPTAVPPAAQWADAGLATHAGFTLLRGIDAAGNACPSLHVAVAVFSAMWIRRVLAAAGAPLPLHLLNLAWLLAITWSTLAVRQHVVLDVLAGAALGVFFGAISPLFASPLASTPRRLPL